MFYILSKVLWLVASPTTIIFVLLASSLLSTLLRRRRTAILAAALSTVGFFAVNFTNLGDLMLRPLEARFQRPADPPNVDGIILLGGGLDPKISQDRAGYELNVAGDRFVESLRLALRYPAASIVISGGVGELGGVGDGAAKVGERFFPAFGIDAKRLILEPNSRTTAENAEEVAKLFRERPSLDREVWLLVTSAYHMPRAVGSFRAVGLNVIPWPVDFRSLRDPVFAIQRGSPLDADAVETAAKEWIGLVAYRLSGRTLEMLPGP